MRLVQSLTKLRALGGGQNLLATRRAQLRKLPIGSALVVPHFSVKL